MGVKFERGPDGHALHQLWYDSLFDDECDTTPPIPPIAVLFTRGTLEKHRERLLPEHFEGITDGGLIMGLDDEFGWVEVYPTKAKLDKAWQALLHGSHAWKNQRIDTLRAQTKHTQRLLHEAVNAWPQLDTDADLSGADLVEWFTLWRRKAKACLHRDDADTASAD